MKKTSVSIERIADRLIEVLTNEQLTAEYKKDGHVSECYGWDGRAMSPLSRAAFVDSFGLEAVETAEAMAARVVEIRRNAWAATAYAAHAAEADEQLSQYPATTPAAGSFVWGFSSGLKCEGGLAYEIRNLFRDLKDENHRPARLCKVCEVYEMTAEEVAAAEGFGKLITTRRALGYGLPGGVYSEDEGVTGVDGDEYATYYTMTAAIVMPGGRWFLIDSEGYNYSRYIYLPATASDMFAEELEFIRVEYWAKMEEDRRKAEEEAAARLADYRARCAKWSPLMTSTKPAAEAVAAARAAYENRQKLSGYSFARKSAEKKALDAAERKLHNTARANILAMVRAAFPGVAFSVKNNSARGYGFGEDWLLSWTDGPTVVELTAAVDLDLFTRTSYESNQCDGFDPVRAEFTEFVDEFGEGPHYAGGVEVSREKGDEFDALRATAEAVEVSNAQDMTEEDAAAVADALGCSRSFLSVKAGRRYWLNAYECALYVWSDRSFCHREEPTTPTTPTEPKGDAYADGQESHTATDAAPAEGLELVSIADGVAVVGDERTTYRNRKAIKSHGATWNRDAKQWQATTAEAVAALREWFGLTNEEATAEASAAAPAPADDAAPVAAAVAYDTAEKLEAAAELRRRTAELIAEAEELEAAAPAAKVNNAAAVSPRLVGEYWPYLPMKEGKEPFPVFNPSEPVAATAAEARAAGAYIVGLLYKAGDTIKPAPTFTPICDEYNTNPADLLATLQGMSERGEITHFNTRDDFHGVTVRYCAGGGWYKEIFTATLPDDVRPAYQLERKELAKWAELVEKTDPSTNEAKATA